MQRLKEKDSRNYTVIMVQPEHETGGQEFDNDRDHSPAADRAWNAQVPENLMQHLIANDGHLVKWLPVSLLRS
ncbi:MAG: hypothetical protein ABSF95_06020 [Verrucomicrobiota bacterium]|jgi:hypothetical protein